MKNSTRYLLSCIVLFTCSLAAYAEAPAGRWEGTIDAPGNPIGITIDLEAAAEGTWTGNIDIPVQNLQNFPLADITVDGSSVSFKLPGIPGAPVFQGTLAGEGSKLAGDFHQGGGTVPFQLQRTGDAQIEATAPGPEVPAEIAAVLVGRWEGALNVPGQPQPLRLALVLATDSEGNLSATLDSPDQGQTGMPITRLTVDGDTVRAELTYASATYEGTLNAERTEMSGTWQQGGGSLPLVLVKQSTSTTEGS